MYLATEVCPTKASAMSANEGCGIDDRERIQNTRRDPLWSGL
jgi:hypothetical protein